MHVFFNFPAIKVEEVMKDTGMFRLDDDKRSNNINCKCEANDLIQKFKFILNNYMAFVEANYIHIISDFEIKTRLDKKHPMYVLVECGCYILRDGLTGKEIQEKRKRITHNNNMEKEKKETIETREYQSEFMKKIFAGAPIANTEWFQYVANAKDCNPFTKNMGFDRTIKVFMRICQALADFGPEWRAKGYPAIIDAVEKHTLLKGRDIVDELMKNLDKNEEKIDAMQRELNKLNFDIVPDLKRKLLVRDIERVYGGPSETSEELIRKLHAEGLIDAEEQEIEKSCIQFSMERHPGDLKAAAKELGLTQKALKSKLIKYEL